MPEILNFVIALLPMKKDSERVPNKNKRKISGKPLFFFIADNLKQVDSISQLFINTDCPEIATLAKKRYGNWVSIIERPNNLRGHEISMNNIIEYDIKKIGIENDFLQTHSTNPLLKASTISETIKIYTQNKKKLTHDSLFSVSPMKKRLYDKNFSPINHNPKVLIQTQNLDPIYEENSNIYIFSGNSFLKNQHRIGENPYLYKMRTDNFESLDIDEKNDWILAEILLNKIIDK